MSKERQIEYPAREGAHPADEGPPGEQEILEQLERLVRSVHFRNSKRYPTLLRFVVEQSLGGAAVELKERTLGTEVFGRRPDYDTTADPIVRFTAGEIRKRLAQYYLMPEHAHEVRFELPLGSYVPRFSGGRLPGPQLHADSPAEAGRHPRPEPHAELPVQLLDALPTAAQPTQPPAMPDPAHRTVPAWAARRAMVTFAGLLVLLTAAVGLTTLRAARGRLGAGTSPFWKPLLGSRLPCMIVLGVHTIGLDGVEQSPDREADDAAPPSGSMLSSMLRSDMVPVSDVVSYGYLTDLLARNNRTYTTRSATESTFSQIRGQPLILVGGFDNIWTMRLTRDLRFRLVPGSQDVNSIVDSQHPLSRWTFNSAQNLRSNSEDFGIVASFFDPEIEQNVVVVAGIGKFGTEAAAEFATDAGLLGHVAYQSTAGRRNYEILLSTHIIEGHQGPPHLVAVDVW